MLSGVTSSIQDQLDDKIDASSVQSNYAPISLASGATTITTVGALTTGSIASGFGDIDVGDNSISGKTLNIGNIAISATNIGHEDDIDLLELNSNLLKVNGTLQATDLKLNNVSVTASADEINIMDGVTATTADINKLDGLTATQEKLNFVSNVSSDIQTQLDSKLTSSDAQTTYAPIAGKNTIVTVGALTSGSIGGAMTVNTSGDITTSGKVTSTTGDIGDVRITGSTVGTNLDADLLTLSSGKLEVKGTVDATGLVLNSTSVTTTGAEINKLSGLTVDSSKLNLLANVSSDVNTLISSLSTTDAETLYAPVAGAAHNYNCRSFIKWFYWWKHDC